MADELDYLFVLKALNEIPFNVGRKLLIDFLNGSENNDSIFRNSLQDLETFGSLAYEKEDLDELIDSLLLNNMIRIASVKGNRFWKVLEITDKGIQEIDNPSLYKKKIAFNYDERETVLTEEDKEVFDAFGEFLQKYNDFQKKSIISNNKHILCIAGAGSGKTSVLIKRIEFLIKYRSVDPSKILAITFTRKARQEMIDRLSEIGYGSIVRIETFNSFCEKILIKHNDLLYDTFVKVITYRDKILMIRKALSSLNLDMGRAINIYFSYAQRRSKTNDQLANIFLNDCFFIRDYFKFKNRKIEESAFEPGDVKHKESAKLVFSVCNYLEAYMKKNGLRDFADQLIDTINLFEHKPELIPLFEHILIDEYQDVNSTQIKLIDLLNPDNLFCVGDPRQSIYGWRGSDVQYILGFNDKYPDCEIITLVKNYRSSEHIVSLVNKSIEKMGLADMESSIKGDKDIRLLKFESEDAEFEFVLQRILSSQVSREEIFVLARTNRQLNDISNILRQRGIKHIVRSDEMKRNIVALEGDVTLATVHAIKGLEAEMVFVIGCTPNNFPCKGSEHPVVDMIKVDEYDKGEEERRLFYVAMSRAKKSLYLTYSGKKYTPFITDKMIDIIDEKTNNHEKKDIKFNVVKSNNVLIRMKEWRKKVSSEQKIPAFMVMHDKTLFEISVNMPLTLDDLGRVKGMGHAKIIKYGEDILNIVNGK